MNISSVLVSPCNARGTHGAAPIDGHSEGGTAAAAAVPSSGDRALHTIMLEPGRARDESRDESRDASRGAPWCGGSSVGARSTFEWRPLTVEAEVLHAEALLEHAPVSRARGLSLRPLARPSASWRSGGSLSQWQRTPRAAPGCGQPRPISPLGGAGRPCSCRAALSGVLSTRGHGAVRARRARRRAAGGRGSPTATSRWRSARAAAARAARGAASPRSPPPMRSRRPRRARTRRSTA